MSPATDQLLDTKEESEHTDTYVKITRTIFFFSFMKETDFADTFFFDANFYLETYLWIRNLALLLRLI